MNKRIPNGYGWPDPLSTPSRFEIESEQGGLKQRVVDTTSDLTRKAGEFIGANPAACLIAAVTCGVLIGWLAKRRT